MMIDPIAVAKQKVKLKNTLNSAEAAKTSLEAAGRINSPEFENARKTARGAQEKLNQLSDPNSVTQNILNTTGVPENLPIEADPELIKKQAMADAQAKRNEIEAALQQKKDEEIEKLKKKVEDVAGPVVITAVSTFLKLPNRDPKFLALMAYQRAKKELGESKQKASKENLKKSSEIFQYPMKPSPRLDLGQLPTPEAPKIPEIPKIKTEFP